MPLRDEIHHNTPEQIEGYLRMAAEVVEKIELAEDLRQVAYAKAVDLFAAKQVIIQQPAAIAGLVGPQH